MLSFHQAIRKQSVPADVAVGPYGGGHGKYSPSAHRSRGANPKLTGDVLSVDAAAKFLQQAAEERLRQEPSMDVVQLVNQLARQQQWSPELGRAAAAKAMEWALAASGGRKAPGFSGPFRGNLDKGSALDKLNARAAEVRKADPTLTPEQAFAKVYDSDRGLRARHYAERMGALGVGPSGRVAEHVV